MAPRKQASTSPTGTTVPASTGTTVPASTGLTPEEQFAQQQGDMPTATVTEQKTTGVPQGYVGPERIFGGVSKPMRPTQLTYTGVMEYNPATGRNDKPIGLYDIYKQAGTILSTEMDDVERAVVLNGLKSRGIGYSKNEIPGNGFTAADRSAFAELLLQSNIAMRPWQETFTYLMSRTAPVPTGGAGRKFRVTPDSEIAAVVQDSAQNLLGRSLSAQEVNRIADMIQEVQLQYQRGVAGPAGSLQEMPSVQNLALQEVERKYGAESDQLKMVSFADLLNRAVSNRG